MTRLTTPSTSTEAGKLTIADLAPTAGLTDQYDDLILRLCDIETHASSLALCADITDSRTRFCHHLRHALQSDTVYLCERDTLDIVATSSSMTTEQPCSDTLALHNALTSMVSDLWNCADPIYLPEISVFPDSNKFSFSIFPLNNKCGLLLIAVDAEVEDTLVGHYLSAAISGLFDIFRKQKQPDRTTCESHIFDLLQTEFRNSSAVVADLRLSRFKQSLKATPVSFSDLTPSNDNASPEALCTELPQNLYTVAALWEGDFIAALDSHCLTESSYGYKTLCENHNLLKFETSRPLQIKVHTQSLSNSIYIDTLIKLKEKSVIHESRLTFDILSETNRDQSTVVQSDQLAVLRTEPGLPVVRNKKQPASAPVTVNISEEFDIMSAHGIGHHSNTRLNKAAND